MAKSTIITFGRVALEAHRARLARAQSVGGQALTLEHMVERLAGGFLRIVDVMTLREAVSQALPDADVGELEAIKDRPGMVVACADSLMAWWMSGLSPDRFLGHRRIEALAGLEAAVERELPAHVRKPADIVALAVERAGFARKLFGEMRFTGMTDLHPVWRPVLAALAGEGGPGFVWDGGALPAPDFLKEPAFAEAIGHGRVSLTTGNPAAPATRAVTCADARHEVVEALRWAMELLDAGERPEDIAIATVATAAYEGLMATVSRHGDVDLHMAQGLPALMTPAGQECAALADILLRGLTHKRFRRFADVRGDAGPFEGLPERWADRLPHEASLKTLERWGRLLARNDLSDLRDTVFGVVETLSRGIDAARGEARGLLSPEARVLWDAALRSGPAAAIDVTLKRMRTRARGSALDRVCFMHARDLVAAPRKHVRLIGLASRLWPRRDPEDGLLPGYVVPKRLLSPMSLGEIDRRDFRSILATTVGSVVFSWPRLDQDGREQRPSPLVPDVAARHAQFLERERQSLHPASEGDRIFMRPAEFAETDSAKRAKRASLNWVRPTITEHDGLIPPGHPRLEAVFDQVQSATSLRRMIRDPLGYVWKYALGFDAPEFEDEPLVVDARVLGNLVHAILRLAAERLERGEGLAAARPEAIASAVRKARFDAGVRMEQTQPIPPALIWTQALDLAETFARDALAFRGEMAAGTRAYAEVPFGGSREWIGDDLPWATDGQVLIPGTGVKVQGVIDRLDLSPDGTAHVVDYKTGKTPKTPSAVGIDGGKELQRAIYRYAAETLLDGIDEVVSALFFAESKTYVPLDDPEHHLRNVTEAVRAAMTAIRGGHALPGVDASDAYNDLLFAYPARAASVYLKEKRELIGPEFDDLKKIWSIA